MYKKQFTHSAYGILKAMKVGGTQRGFTIVETLIVLAVTGALFLVAAVAISGRQARSEFEQAINDVRSQIDQTINEVATGFYPNNNNFSCTAGPSGPVLASGATAQGSNTDCIFLGKVIQFKVNGTDPEQFTVFPVAGLRVQASGNEVSTIGQAQPKVIAPTTAAPTLPSAVERKKLLYGLTTVSAKYGTSGVDIGAVAFLSSLAGYSGSTLNSGAQVVDVYPIVNSTLNATQNAAATTINNNFVGSPQNPAGVRVCFASGGTNESGLITIGSANRQMSVSLKIYKGSKTCS